MSLQVEENEIILALKEGLYSFISGVLNLAPEQKHLDILVQSETVEVLNEVSKESIPFLSSSHSIKEVVQDFNDLFMVPGDKYVKPYESVYLDETDIIGIPRKGLLMGPSTLAVKKFYESAGFEILDKTRELPDYIGVEFEFIAALIREERKLRETNDIVKANTMATFRHEFLIKHPGRWIDKIANEILKNADTNFYRGIAQLAKDIVLQDIT